MDLSGLNMHHGIPSRPSWSFPLSRGKLKVDGFSGHSLGREVVVRSVMAVPSANRRVANACLSRSSDLFARSPRAPLAHRSGRWSVGTGCTSMLLQSATYSLGDQSRVRYASSRVLARGPACVAAQPRYAERQHRTAVVPCLESRDRAASSKQAANIGQLLANGCGSQYE